MRRRQRTCSNPRPNLLGNACEGDSSDYDMCLITACPGKWYLFSKNIAFTFNMANSRSILINNPVRNELKDLFKTT